MKKILSDVGPGAVALALLSPHLVTMIRAGEPDIFLIAISSLVIISTVAFLYVAHIWIPRQRIKHPD
jgi:hypothetical protein